MSNLNPYAVVADLAAGINTLNDEDLPRTSIAHNAVVRVALRNLWENAQTEADVNVLKAVARGLSPQGQPLPQEAKLDLDLCLALRRRLKEVQVGAQPVYTSAPSPESVITTEGSFESLVTFDPPSAPVARPSAQVSRPWAPSAPITTATIAPTIFSTAPTKSGKPRDAYGRVRMTHAHPEWKQHCYTIMAMHYEGYRYEEISPIVGVDASQVSKRITQLRDEGYVIPPAHTVPPEWRSNWPKLVVGTKPLKYKRAWDMTETKDLYYLYRGNYSVAQMADVLKRNPKDVERKIQIEGLREIDDPQGRTILTDAIIEARLIHLDEQRARKRLKKKAAFHENKKKKNSSSYR